MWPIRFCLLAASDGEVGPLLTEHVFQPYDAGEIVIEVYLQVGVRKPQADELQYRVVNLHPWRVKPHTCFIHSGFGWFFVLFLLISPCLFSHPEPRTTQQTPRPIPPLAQFIVSLQTLLYYFYCSMLLSLITHSVCTVLHPHPFSSTVLWFCTYTEIILNPPLCHMLCICFTMVLWEHHFICPDEPGDYPKK